MTMFQLLERFQNMDRRWVFLGMGLAILLPMLFPIEVGFKVDERVQSLYDTVEEQAERWVTNNGCGADPAPVESLGEASSIRRFEACSSNAPVHVVFAANLEHTWPSSASERILDFLMRFERD